MSRLIRHLFGRPHMLRRLAVLLVSVFLMGLCVAIFDLTDVGTDPCSSLNLGLAARLGLSFGVVQLSVNMLVMVYLLIFGRREIGLGTLANMTLVGFSADACFPILRTWIPAPAPLGLRLAWFLPAMAVFVMAVAAYLLVDLGAAPYDAVPVIFWRRHAQKLPFRLVRMLWDGLYVLGSLAAGGPVGIMTVACILCLGPVIDWTASHFRRFFA